MKILHAADIHLDSPMRGLDRYEGSPAHAMRASTRRALTNLVDLALAESVALVLVAGDLFDGTWKDFNTGLFFASQMGRLRAKNIPVVLVRGNHDAASSVARALQWPENVHELSSRAPETKLFEKLGIAVHGQGFASRAIYEDLSAKYPRPIGGAINIGLLHTSLDGRPGHEPYAPSRIGALVNKGYDYWALGHVHEREVLHEDPWVVFPGNLQGRHAREIGAKGATLVTCNDGRITEVEHRPLDVVRWFDLPVLMSPASDLADALDLVRDRLGTMADSADGRAMAVRVRIVGETKLHEALWTDAQRFTNEVRALGLEIAPDAMWIEKVSFQTKLVQATAGLREKDDALGFLTRALDEPLADADLAQILGSLDDLRAKLPHEMVEGQDAVIPTTAEQLRALLPELREIVLTQVLRGGDYG